MGRGAIGGAWVLLAMVVGCVDAGPGAEGEVVGYSAPEAAEPEALSTVFDRVGAEQGVPADLLRAVAWIETRWSMVYPEDGAHTHGMPHAFGVMALREGALEQGAELAEVSVHDAQTRAEANVRAAAAWFRAHAGEADPASLETWGDAVAEYAGIALEEARADYVGAIYGALREGLRVDGIDGFAIEPHPGLRTPVVARSVEGVDGVGSIRQALAGPDYPDSIWRASPNHSSRPSGSAGNPQMLIIHSCEGSYAGCWSWLATSGSGVSAHYVVNETGSEISQLVREYRKAWHIGASYNCSLNDSTLCNLNGVGSNGFTVGIEHAGFASQGSWDAGLLDASARLACDITEQYGIPRDANHIVAHGQLQSNRTDPGAGWPWEDYIDLVRFHCGDTPPFSEIVVDDNNANNDASVASFSASSSWIGSSYSSGYWGSGYHYASTVAASDPATFWFYLAADGTHPIDARWVAGSNRSTAAPFVIYNAAGSVLGTPKVNQQINGSTWVQLGSFPFTAGWNRIALSRWAAAGSVVLADAVRIRE